MYVITKVMALVRIRKIGEFSLIVYVLMNDFLRNSSVYSGSVT